jgi:hypothetical protein
MRLLKALIILITITTSQVSFAQKDSTQYVRNYSFLIQDSPAQLLTMRQMNQSYLSAYRLFARGLNSTIEDQNLADLIQFGVISLFLMPLTHEEGHRSILTANNIGSISQPYFNKHGAAYVKGVTDGRLMDLRDNDLPTYIRLHTAGLESDYMLTNRIEALASFGQDDFDNYKIEYWSRKLCILQYFITGLFHYEMDLKEEDKELDRDIVGHDIYSMARHLHRPDMDFQRYTDYKELTKEEVRYVNRLGYRSFLNLLNPLIIGKTHFKLNESTSFNIGLGHSLSPFGDYIDQNIWLKHEDLNIAFYSRQFENKDNWFAAFGLSVNEYSLSERIVMNLSGHIWQQPKDFDFNTSDSFTGGAIDAELKYFFETSKGTFLEGFSLDLGLIYKTKGFLPEEVHLDEHFGFRIGTTLRL